MTGDRAHDFVGVGLFVIRGDPALPARFTEAHGHNFEPEGPPDPADTATGFTRRSPAQGVARARRPPP
ncbi:hypothetical protein B7767_27920, partial [Streptomyces sp. 13-12-16]